MKNFTKKKGSKRYFSLIPKIPIYMRITIVLLFGIILHAGASSLYSQTEIKALSLRNISIEEVLNTIEENSQFYFLYNSKLINVDRKVSVQTKGQSIESILESIFKQTDIVYKIEGYQIILSKKDIDRPIPQPERKIGGVVKDKNGEVIIGASVFIKGTTVGAMTDIDGHFSLMVPNNVKSIHVSFVGMKSQEVILNNKSTYEILLQDEAISMNEVVVTALGIKKEAKSLSYNVQQLNAEDINKVSDANFVNNLNGRIAGVTINSAASGVGGSSRVVMRGVKSISGNNNALYVIDGIPMPNLSTDQPNDSFAGAGQTGDGISNINPDDIESISVLSGPSAAALYGSAASNGVILVTTKKGQSGKVSISLSNNTMFSRPLVLPEFQNTYGPTEKSSYYSWGDRLATPSSYDPKDFFQTGVNVTNSASLSTGTENSQTYVSFGTVNSEGIIHNNDYDRYNFSVRNTTQFFNKKMSMDLSFMTSKVKEQNMISQGSYFNPLVPLYLFPAGDDFSKVEIYERYDASRNLQTQFWPYDDLGLAAQNPYWIINRNKFVNNKHRYMINATLKYEFNNWINISTRGKYDHNTSKFEKKFDASTNTLFASETGYYSLNNDNTTQMYGEAMVNINKYIDDGTWNITANLGGSFENVDYEQNMYGGKLQDVPNLFSFNNVNQSTAERSQSGYETRKRSLFASSQIGYKSLAYLDLTARNDWPSTLAGSNTSSFFYPTIGLSGIITDIFKISSDWMPYMKMRISYSEVGNEPAPHLTIPTYALAGGTPNTQTRMPNKDLKPELTKSWEGGVNFTFFKNKLRLDATAYKSSTYNQFFEPTLSSSSGYTSVVVNAGRVDNKGIELSARVNDSFGDFQWGTFLTYSLNRNKIIELLPGWTNPVNGEVISLSELDMGGTGSVKVVLKEGGSMGDIYVNTLKTDEHGAIYVHPSDHVVVADANNYVYGGNTNPKYNIGWGGNVEWKGISLNFMFTGRVGGTVVSNTQAIMDAFGASKASADARDAGGALVNGKRIPAMQYYQTIGGGTAGIASMYCYSATNVRLGELSVGYNIPINKWVDWIKSMNVSFTGRNLFFLYRKAPYDPELTASTGTYYQGIDYFMTPSLRNMGFAVKINF